MFQAHDGDSAEIFAICYKPNRDSSGRELGGGVFFTAGNDPDIRVWGLPSLELEASLFGHRDSITALAIDGELLISAGEDWTLRIWSVMQPASAFQLAVINTHARCVRQLAFMPDTGHIATACSDGSVVVWDSCAVDEESGECGKLLRELRHSSRFRCVAYRQSTKDLLVGTEDAQVLIYPPEGEPVLADAAPPAEVKAGDEEEAEDGEEGEGGDVEREAAAVAARQPASTAVDAEESKSSLSGMPALSRGLSSSSVASSAARPPRLPRWGSRVDSESGSISSRSRPAGGRLRAGGAVDGSAVSLPAMPTGARMRAVASVSSLPPVAGASPRE
eukprot:PLAT8337.1.p1 GENE.PLAT8337.1~~PLAT8337.1.p1  ORF type:complete len:333 (+),score=120.11 PLAT8337.1:561-1559(+)